MDEQDGGFQEELELLEAIYLEELTVERTESGEVSSVNVQIHPATGDNEEERYVCLTLEFNIPRNYPETVPEMVIRNPRGLADDLVSKLREKLNRLAVERAGAPMLYELIELGKESLTESNVPHGQCVICLEYFAKGEPFTKTECYHHFHCTCLLRYVEHCMEENEREREEIRQHKHMTLKVKQIVCPVCREAIEYDLDYLRAQTSGGADDEEEVILSKEIRELQRRMANLFDRQKAKGGIIDVEAERNKFLIPSESLADVPYTPSPQNLFSHGPRSVTSDSHDERSKGRGRIFHHHPHHRNYPHHQHHHHQHHSSGASRQVINHEKPLYRDQRKETRHDNSSADSRYRDRRQHGRDKRKEERATGERTQGNERNISADCEESKGKSTGGEEQIQVSKQALDGNKDNPRDGIYWKKPEPNGDIGEEKERGTSNNRPERYRREPRDQKRRKGQNRDEVLSDHSNWSSFDGEEGEHREAGLRHPGRRWSGRGRGRGRAHGQHSQENGDHRPSDSRGETGPLPVDKQKFNYKNKTNNSYQKSRGRSHDHGNNFDRSVDARHMNFQSFKQSEVDAKRDEPPPATRPPPGFPERQRSEGAPGFKVSGPPGFSAEGQRRDGFGRPRPPPGFEERR